ncbi:hypothetical protein ACEQPO_12325 [Bacillus sp. SL00103]
MAGPHVPLLWLFFAKHSQIFQLNRLKQQLIDTAKPLTDQQFPESPNNGYGAGLVDAREAITALTDGIGMVEGQVTNEDVHLDEMKIPDQTMPKKIRLYIHIKEKNLTTLFIKALPMKAEISVLESASQRTQMKRQGDISFLIVQENSQ